MIDLLDDALDAPAPAAPRVRHPGFVLAVSLAVVFALVAAAAGLLAARDSGGDPRIGEVRDAAGTFGAAFVTYDYHRPAQHRDAVLALATGSFAKEHQSAFDQGLRQIITEAKAVSKGFVKDVYVSEVDAEQAQAIVVVDIEHSGTSGPRTLYDVYFRLTFVRTGGTWKVDEVTDLNFDTGAGGASASTSTSVP